MAQTLERFPGFPPDTLRFYEDLARNNGRGWFEEARERHTTSVIEPARSFVRALGAALQSTEPKIRFDAERVNGQGSILRVQRDVRFSTDKRPYKTNLGLLFWFDDRRVKRLCPHFYVGIDPGAVHLYAGLHRLPPVLLSRFRRALLYRGSGRRLEGILQTLIARGYGIGGERFRRVPAKYPEGHPLATLLRYDGAYAERRLAAREAILAGLVDRCAEAFEHALPLLRWISGALGQG